ncbi:MAG TPA: hypothetical protein DCG88_08760 [Sphingobacterium sp.]|nr:hypothetical protein [Sphingobacterium sp.]
MPLLRKFWVTSYAMFLIIIGILEGRVLMMSKYRVYATATINLLWIFWVLMMSKYRVYATRDIGCRDLHLVLMMSKYRVYATRFLESL